MDGWLKNLRSGPNGDSGITPRRPPVVARTNANTDPSKDKAANQKLQTPGVPPRQPAPSSSRTTSRTLVTQLDIGEVQSKSESPSRPSSVDGDDGEDFENDSVRVFVRVRPPTAQEVASDKHETCLTAIGSRTLQLSVKEKQNQVHRFIFDQVLPEDTKQQDVFELAGLVAVDNCLAGYNSSIFAYGQTGAGKTFTVIGQINNVELRGLAPRVFEYLFAKITDHENARGPDTVKYNCRCSFLEIYNETIADLLCPSATNLPIREDPEKGPYVDGLSEPPALNVDEMLAHLLRGAENRHTGETRLNRESSRSHSVFMCTVEKTVTSNGISKCFYAKLNLVDLAGSERIASGAHGGSNATGEHFKEACHINKSLTALGRVTTELVKSQKNGGGGHVPYRDSKLTFLLQSSLGGNAKTLIIANVSPSSICAHETLSTLRFAKQTKHIRNDAKINWTLQGDRLAMQREIERLRMELASARSGVTDGLMLEMDELRRQRDAERKAREEVEHERTEYKNSASQARRELLALDKRLVNLSALSGTFGSHGAGALSTIVEQLEDFQIAASARRYEIAEAERLLAQLQLQAEQEHRARLGQQLHASTLKSDLLSAQLAALIKEKTDLEESCSVLAENFAQAGTRITEQKEQLQVLQTELSGSTALTQELERQLREERGAREEVERQLEEVRAQHRAAVEEAERAARHGSELQARVDDKDAELSQQAARMEGLQRQLEGALSEVQALQSRLAEAQEQLMHTQREGSATSDRLSEEVMQLTSKLEEAEARAQASGSSLDESQKNLQAARDELSSTAARLTDLEAQLQAKADEADSILARLHETESALAAETAAHGTTEADRASLAAQLAASESRCAELSEQLQRRSDEATELSEELRQKRNEAAELAEQLQQKAGEASQLDGQLQQKVYEASNLAEQIQSKAGEVAKLAEQLAVNEVALAEANAATAAAREEVAALTVRAKALEGSAEEQALVHATTAESLRKAEASVVQLEEEVAGLRSQLQTAKDERDSIQARAAELEASLEKLQAEKADLESQLRSMEVEKAELEQQALRQASEAQDMATASTRLEARITELESSKAQLEEQLGQEQTAAAALREQLGQEQSAAATLRQELGQEQTAVVTLREQLQQEQAALAAVRGQLENELAAATALREELGQERSTAAALREQLGQEQATVSALRDTVARNDVCIAELREQLQQEAARANTARREMAESAAASQRQMAELEEQQLRDVQALKDELDRRNTELKARDQEMVRTNFALKGEIDRLQAALEQAKREAAASKANQEQLVASHQATLAGMNERLAKQVAHNKELMTKQDALKQQLDQAQREVESWKTKSERLDGAMADVTRLIRFARNPPDSARSSLIL